MVIPMTHFVRMRFGDSRSEHGRRNGSQYDGLQKRLHFHILVRSDLAKQTSATISTGGAGRRLAGRALRDAALPNHGAPNSGVHPSSDPHASRSSLRPVRGRRCTPSATRTLSCSPPKSISRSCSLRSSRTGADHTNAAHFRCNKLLRFITNARALPHINRRKRHGRAPLSRYAPPPALHRRR